MLFALTATAETVKFSGDARYRFQSIEVGNADTLEPANEQNYRFRLNMLAPVNEYISVGTRLSTGGTSRSSNVPMDNPDPKGIYLDQVYMNYTPYPQLTFTGGRFAVPMRYTDMVFDPDVNFDGTNAHFVTPHVFGNFGGYWLDKALDNDIAHAQAVFMYQVGLTIPYFEPAVSYYDFTHQEGNTYKIADFNVRVPIKKTTLYANYVRNTSVEEQNVGYLVGLSARVSIFGLDYNYRGHRANIFIAPYDNTKLGLTYFMNTVEPTGADYSYNRLMVDFEVTF